MIKKIGITPLIGETYGVKSSIVLDNYINLVRFMGGIPILLPVNPNKNDLKYYSTELDVLILQGGSNSSIEQDNLEFKYIDIALSNKIPIIGICRGLQQLNVYFGGTLCPVGSEKHNSDDAGNTLVHKVTLKDNTNIKSFFNKESILVNSLHVHKIDKFCDNIFDVTMISDDNIIEGIELINSDIFIVAFQFHPEILVAYQNKDMTNLIKRINKEIDGFILKK